jgi:hypothetical protein
MARTKIEVWPSEVARVGSVLAILIAAAAGRMTVPRAQEFEASLLVSASTVGSAARPVLESLLAGCRSRRHSDDYVPVEALRAELSRIVEASGEWDRRVRLL